MRTNDNKSEYYKRVLQYKRSKCTEALNMIFLAMRSDFYVQVPKNDKEINYLVKKQLEFIKMVARNADMEIKYKLAMRAKRQSRIH